MKKLILTSLAAVAVMSAACFATLTPEKEVSTLTMDNVDALSAGGEVVYDANCVEFPNEICCPDSGPIVYRSKGV